MHHSIVLHSLNSIVCYSYLNTFVEETPKAVLYLAHASGRAFFRFVRTALFSNYYILNPKFDYNNVLDVTRIYTYITQENGEQLCRLQ